MFGRQPSPPIWRELELSMNNPDIYVYFVYYIWSSCGIDISLCVLNVLFLSILFDRYLKVLVQEMTVKADQGFINALIPFFGKGKRTPEQLSKDFQADLDSLSRSLMELSAGSANRGHKNFYDMLHFSPLKVCDASLCQMPTRRHPFSHLLRT